MVTRLDKEQIVSSLKEKTQNSTVAMVADYAGLSMEQSKELRVSLKGLADCVVVKNTLAKIALKDGDIEPLGEYLTGPSLLVVGKDDPSQAIKAVLDFQKKVDPLLTIKGGIFPGESKLLDIDALTAIGKLPAKEVLLGQIAGMLVSTPTTIVNTVNNTIQGIGELAVKVAEKNN